jgi:hypothetical protein
MVFAGRNERGPGAVLVDRPAVAGPRWRPHESLNRHRRPADMEGYLARFQVRPAAGRAGGLDQDGLMPDRTGPLGGYNGGVRAEVELDPMSDPAERSAS